MTAEAPQHETPQPSASQHWVVPLSADLRWRDYGEHVVVYHPPSADTHLLNPLAAEALRLLWQSPLTAAELSRRIAALFELQDDGELLRQMEQCLTQFAELGLIEPAHADEGHPDA